MTSANELMEITREACTMIHERLPENDYIVSVFQEKDNDRLDQTFRGRMDIRSLTALANATINEIAEQTGTSREHVLEGLKHSGNTTAKVVDFRRRSYKENQDD